MIKLIDINNVSMFDDSFFIAFDNNLSFNPYTLYMNGELSIMYLLNQKSLVSSTPTIKCDIIDAKNALTLHESDVHYMYKPSIITTETIDVNSTQIECYKMIYKLPPSNEYEIPPQLNFKFVEHCFGNEWSLIWDSNQWSGDNVQGRSNGKAESSKQYLRVDKKFNDYGMSGCYVRCKHDEWNKKFLDNGTTTENYMKNLFNGGITRTMLLYKDGTSDDGKQYRIEIDMYHNVEPYSKEGYDYIPLFLYIQNNNKDEINSLLNRIDKIALDMTVNSAVNRLTFRWDTLHQDQHYGYLIDLIAEIDSIEKVNVYWSAKHIKAEPPFAKQNETSRDIVLYLRKDYTDPIDEVNWDSSTNAFDYIIKQQYYEISPNPNAATTLYTDFNITSSKIITDDNITTMRSDLNMVSNTVDVVSYDMRDVKNNIETLNSEMAETKTITKYLKEDIDKTKIISYTALAFGIAGTVGSAASIGMQLTSKGVQFASKEGYQFLNSFRAEPKEIELVSIGADPFMTNFSLRSVQTDLTPLFDWCNEEYKPLPEIVYEDENDDSRTTATSIHSTLDICNRFRDSLKPSFRMLVNRVNELSDEIGNIDVTNELKQYISIYYLVREDVIDLFIKADNEHHVLMIEFEDNINEGLIVFKTFATLKSSSSPSVNQWQRRFYIKIVDGSINEYKGVNETVVVGDITINPLARSEDDRQTYMPNAELIIDTTERFISIPIVNENYLITGAVIEECTCKRQMNYAVKDIAYMNDIDALNKKIDTLAEQSHVNDISMYSLQETFPTVDEVNEVNDVLKTDMPSTVDMSTIYTKQEVDDQFALKTDIPSIDLTNYRTKDDLTIPANNISFNVYDEEPESNAYVIDKFVDGMRVVGVAHHSSNANDSFDFTFNDANPNNGSTHTHYITATNVMYVMEFNDKLLMTIKRGNQNISFDLTSITYGDVDELALKSELTNYLKNNENETLNGNLTVNGTGFSALKISSPTNTGNAIMQAYTSNLQTNATTAINLGKNNTIGNCVQLFFKEPSIGVLRIGTADTIMFTPTNINLNKPTTINDNLTVNGSIINTALENRIKELESQITLLKPSYPWSEFYKGFDERVEYFNEMNAISHYIFYTYDLSSGAVVLRFNHQMINSDYNYLCILTDDYGVMSYIRVDTSSKQAYLNEIVDNNVEPVSVVSNTLYQFVINTIRFNTNDVRYSRKCDVFRKSNTI